MDLSRLAGMGPVGMASQIVSADRLDMASPSHLRSMAVQYGLAVVSVDDVVHHLWQTEVLVRRVSSARLPTEFGDFTAVCFKSLLDETEHIALVREPLSGVANVLTAIHHECPLGDVFSGLNCSCRSELYRSLEEIACEGSGILIYLRHQRGVSRHHQFPSGLAHVLDSRNRPFHRLEDQILRDLGVPQTSGRRRLTTTSNEPLRPESELNHL